MLKSSLLPILFFIGVTVFLSGAWTGFARPAPEIADSDYSPQSITLDCDALGSEVTATELLDKAIATLACATWLKTTIKQAMIAPDSNCCADGVLQLGPNHCARLELKVRTAGIVSNLLIVSDGGVSAEEQTIGEGAAVLVCELLPEDGKEQHLAVKCCGGPRAVLRELRGSLHNLKLQTGILNGDPVIQLHGDVAASARPMRNCSVFLDAKTLWPHRVEWRSQSQHVMRIEFCDPKVNQQLSLAECERIFSYQPTGAK